MRVITQNFETFYSADVFGEDWLFMVEILNEKGYEKMMTEEQYEKSSKLMDYDGLLL
jgi:hypothetical protein